MTKRVLTEGQEWAIRLCHHDFGGMSLDEAADVMGVSLSQVALALEAAEEIAPSMFPLRTHRPSRKTIRFIPGFHDQLIKEKF